MVSELTLDQVREYHAAHYYGDNVVVVGAGAVDH